jgi:hypothetical protein
MVSEQPSFGPGSALDQNEVGFSFGNNLSETVFIKTGSWVRLLSKSCDGEFAAFGIEIGG